MNICPENKLKFYKWQGLGNDFIILTSSNFDPSGFSPLAVRLCDRHYGVGGDGLIYLFKDDDNIINMVIFNADGSLAGMCGNGIRCLAAMAHRLGWITLGEETPVKVGRSLKLVTVLSDSPYLVKVDMGKAECLRENKGRLPGVNGTEYTGLEIDMGNPHLVLMLSHSCIEISETEKDMTPVFRWPDISACGAELEHCSSDEERAVGGQNVEFVIPQNKNHLHMRVWERGVGETLACGTGACASFVAANRLGLCGESAVVHLPGGRLSIAYGPRQHIMMTGPAVFVFEAYISLV
ncbi:MAG: diaminopimelate epimerase [Candidatus Bruticola sp.]